MLITRKTHPEFFRRVRLKCPDEINFVHHPPKEDGQCCCWTFIYKYGLGTYSHMGVMALVGDINDNFPGTDSEYLEWIIRTTDKLMTPGYMTVLGELLDQFGSEFKINPSFKDLGLYVEDILSLGRRVNLL